jgi:hypothetical protein
MLTQVGFREFRKVLALFHPAAQADVERRLPAGGTRYARRGRKDE